MHRYDRGKEGKGGGQGERGYYDIRSEGARKLLMTELGVLPSIILDLTREQLA